MVFTEEDKALIKNVYFITGYETQKLVTEFPEKDETGQDWKAVGEAVENGDA